MRLISSCGTGWWPGSLPTSITWTSADSPASRERGPSLSATTTSACARSRRPRTVRRPASAGPPPTRATVPMASSGDRRCRRSGSSPDSRAAATPSRRAAARFGSPSVLTATVTSSIRATAGTQAAEAAESPPLTHQMRSSSASAAIRSCTSAEPEWARTSHAPSRSAEPYSRCCQSTRPAAAASVMSSQA